MSESLTTNKTAIILTALEVETRAVLRHLGEYTTETVSGAAFFKGQIEGREVAVAEVGSGNNSAAAIAVRAIEHYKPQVALFVGVAGGVKDVAIGDAVVATKVYGYEAGKDTGSGFRPRPDVFKVTHALEQCARVLRQSSDWKRRLNPTISHGPSAVYVAPIAAGEKVVASTRSATAKLIKLHYSDAVAVEMEGRGFLEGIHVSHPTQGCVVRGISDLLSGKSNADKSGSQERAADVASAVAFEILTEVVDAMTPRPSQQPAKKFIEHSPTFCPSAYFQKGETLAQVGLRDVDQVSYSFTGVPEAFLRIIPHQALERPIPLAHLKEIAQEAELLRPSGYGGFTFINSYGAILYSPPGPSGGGPVPFHWATQLFQNAELWSVTDSIIIRQREWRPSSVPFPNIPATVFERAFYNALHKNIVFSHNYLHMKFPCTIVLGLIGLAGSHLGVNDNDIRGPIQADHVILRRELSCSTPAAINTILLEFFEEVFDKTGYARPSRLHGFPPDPPHP